MKAKTILSEDPLYQRLQEALSRIHLFTPEEQKEHQRKMQKLKEEMGHERFLAYLRKQAGLE